MTLIPSTTQSNRRGQRGSTMLVVLALLGIMTILITADFIAARGVDRELKLTNQRQTAHWQAVTARNQVPPPADAAHGQN